MRRKYPHKAEIERFLTDDLESYRVQSSWDYLADIRFARFVGDNAIDIKIVDMFDKALKTKSSDNTTLTMLYHREYFEPVRKKRLQELNRLAKMGIVKKGWIGVSYHEWGVNRIRTYSLILPTV